MFSQQEKQKIAAEVERLLLAMNHPEMPKEKPQFALRVEGLAVWSWADIAPNWTVESKAPGVNPWNEQTHEAIAQNAPKVTMAVKANNN
jgi:hypothetical protein